MSGQINGKTISGMFLCEMVFFCLFVSQGWNIVTNHMHVKSERFILVHKARPLLIDMKQFFFK